MTALLVSLVNLSLSCYPDRLEYVDQVLGFAKDKIAEFADKSVHSLIGSITDAETCSFRPEIHHPQTTSNLLSLLLAPINSYQSALTLLALPRYIPLLQVQSFSTRRAIAQAIVGSIIKNETALETPEDVAGIFELALVLIKDQGDVGPPVRAPSAVSAGRGSLGPGARASSFVGGLDGEDVAEEQSWVARIVHLFKADTLDVQFEVG